MAAHSASESLSPVNSLHNILSDMVEREPSFLEYGKRPLGIARSAHGHFLVTATSSGIQINQKGDVAWKFRNRDTYEVSPSRGLIDAWHEGKERLLNQVRSTRTSYHLNLDSAERELFEQIERATRGLDRRDLMIEIGKLRPVTTLDSPDGLLILDGRNPAHRPFLKQAAESLPLQDGNSGRFFVELKLGEGAERRTLNFYLNSEGRIKMALEKQALGSHEVVDPIKYSAQAALLDAALTASSASLMGQTSASDLVREGKIIKLPRRSN